MANAEKSGNRPSAGKPALWQLSPRRHSPTVSPTRKRAECCFMPRSKPPSTLPAPGEAALCVYYLLHHSNLRRAEKLVHSNIQENPLHNRCEVFTQRQSNILIHALTALSRWGGAPPPMEISFPPMVKRVSPCRGFDFPDGAKCRCSAGGMGSRFHASRWGFSSCTHAHGSNSRARRPRVRRRSGIRRLRRPPT